jgi:hypothetical protein
MIGRLGELLDEALDLAGALRACRTSSSTARRSRCVSSRSRARARRCAPDVGAVAGAADRIGTIVDELYLSPPTDAEVPDA